MWWIQMCEFLRVTLICNIHCTKNEDTRTIILLYNGGKCQIMKFSVKDFFSKCDQMRSFLRIWSYLLKKSLMEIFIFFAVTLNWK